MSGVENAGDRVQVVEETTIKTIAQCQIRSPYRYFVRCKVAELTR